MKGNTRHDAAVDVYFKVSGEPLQLIDSVTADGNGDFSVPATVRRAVVPRQDVDGHQPVGLGQGRLDREDQRPRPGQGLGPRHRHRWPVAVRLVVLYQRLTGGKLHKLATVHTTSGGVSWKIKSGKGTKTYRATYTSSGASASAVVSVSAKVK